MLEKVILDPIQKFIKVESLSGILLFFATILALIWANSPLGTWYDAMLHLEFGIYSSNFQLIKPLELWVNDGLMAIFFFLIGLEIKREIQVGELNSPQKAVLPIFAAIGGMAVPAMIFVLFNNDIATMNGWAIPMATDIAFSLAVLKLLGKRVPISLKIFLTAFAIVDDLGAVMVIALFYSSGIKWGLLMIAAALISGLYALGHKGVYSGPFWFITGLVVWFCFLKAGIHPTIAGILLAFTVPIQPRKAMKEFLGELIHGVDEIEQEHEENSPLLKKTQVKHIDYLVYSASQAQSPLQYLEYKLHNWVAYAIMPIFALFNAGVHIEALASLNQQLIWIIALALVLGNPIGIFSMSSLATRLGLATLPKGTNAMQLLGVSLLAGVGFTMSIFIANLAFAHDKVLLDSAKIGVLLGSILAGVAGYLVLRLSSKKEVEDLEKAESQAELTE